MGIAEGLTSVVGNVVGGLFQRQANKDNYENQKEFAQHGISWKVEDAKRAGLHPLFALSGGNVGYSPSAQPLMTGQDVAQSARAFMSKEDQAIKDATLAEIQSRTELNQVQAQAVASARARDEQRDAQSYGLGGSKDFKIAGPVKGTFQALDGMGGQSSPKAKITGSTDQAKINPMEIPSPRSDDASRTAGPSFPWFSSYQVDKNFRIDLPYSQEGPSEAREAISLYDWPSIIGHNVRVYGEGWLTRFIRYIGGMDPNATMRFRHESQRPSLKAPGPDAPIYWRR